MTKNGNRYSVFTIDYSIDRENTVTQYLIHFATATMQVCTVRVHVV